MDGSEYGRLPKPAQKGNVCTVDYNVLEENIRQQSTPLRGSCQSLGFSFTGGETPGRVPLSILFPSFN